MITNSKDFKIRPVFERLSGSAARWEIPIPINSTDSASSTKESIKILKIRKKIRKNF